MTPALTATTTTLTDEDSAIISDAKRLAWIDYLKALGIFLVVYGHSTLSGGGVVSRWIFAFHIPLFFLISGYLIKERHLKVNFKTFVRRGMQTFLYPYVVLGTIGYLFWLLVLRKFGENVHLGTPVLTPLLAALYGTCKPDHFHTEPIVLWFLPCLFVSQILFYLAFQAKGRFVYVVSATLCLLGVVLPKWLALPFQFETALVAQAFVLLGFEAKQRGILALAGRHPIRWGIGLLAVGTVFAFLNERVDMRASEYGNVFLFLPGSLALCFSMAILFYNLPKLSVAEVVSRDTIFIFGFHAQLFSIFTAFYVYVLKQAPTFRNDPTVSFIASIVNCLLLSLGAVAFMRLFPRLVALRRNK